MATIIRKRGDTYPYKIQIVEKISCDPIDVTGFSFLLTVDPSAAPVDDTNNLFQISGVIIDSVNGIVGFSPNETQADNVGNYYYDIQMTDADLAKRTIDDGKFVLKQDITK
jgi:hypothetical protein